MEVIKNTINNIIQQWMTKAKEGPGDKNPEDWLRQVLSKKELAHVRYNYFKKGTLSIKVDSSVWLYYLTLQKEKLLCQLRQKSEVIKDIHFCIGEMK